MVVLQMADNASEVEYNASEVEYDASEMKCYPFLMDEEFIKCAESKSGSSGQTTNETGATSCCLYEFVDRINQSFDEFIADYLRADNVSITCNITRDNFTAPLAFYPDNSCVHEDSSDGVVVCNSTCVQEYLHMLNVSVLIVYCKQRSLWKPLNLYLVSTLLAESLFLRLRPCGHRSRSSTRGEKMGKCQQTEDLSQEHEQRYGKTDKDDRREKKHTKESQRTGQDSPVSDLRDFSSNDEDTAYGVEDAKENEEDYVDRKQNARESKKEMGGTYIRKCVGERRRTKEIKRKIETKVVRADTSDGPLASSSTFAIGFGLILVLLLIHFAHSLVMKIRSDTTFYS
uniref:Uncharacterized protein n=1 Tax=Timema shepardi TaxID=629360 RepID=A0A7R9B062_TIMSH|nr:unnamed protein product [Timema shepardi]